ncbi:MAG: PHB depolymerase family esterase [Kofleriaceae bacterium]
MRSAALLLVLAACGDDGGMAGPSRPTDFGGERLATLKTPAALDEGTLYPLVMVLHGYGANGFVQQAYFGANGLPGMNKAFVIAPDGTVDASGKQFWNADAACCDFGNTGVDDVGYLGGILDDILATDWPIDPDRVFVIGHSNGGFMSYRMACERADIIAAIAPLAGNASSQPASCTPAQPVNVLHMHGTMDDTVPFTGAEPSVTQWIQKNGCGSTRTAGPDLDLESNLSGAETHTALVDGCPATGQVELWTIEGGSHIPVFNATFAQTWFDWFQAHARDDS